MRRLTRLLAGRRANGERGAVLVLSAVLVMFVAIGMLALTVDLGNITYNRAQLQNGADASSLALAAACAQKGGAGTPCDVTSLPTDPLQKLAKANGNANSGGDQSMSILTDGPTCIRNYSGATSLPACPDPAAENTTSLSKCQPWPLSESPSSLPYVEVTTQTRMKGNDSPILPFHFAQIFSGGSTGSTSETCARAAWGTVSKAITKAPITISSCQWKAETNNGANYVSTGPAYNFGGPSSTDYGYGAGETPWPSPAREIVITLHDPSDSQSDCDWNGKQTAGGFGYIGDKNTCSVTVEDGWAPINTGNSPPGCVLTGQVFEMPIFDCIVASSSKTPPTGPPPSTPLGVCDPTQKESSGNNSYYHIAGYGKFYVSGTRLTGSDTGSVMPGGHTSCGGSGNSGRCLMGWFLQGTIDDPITIVPPGGGNDFGIYAVLPAG